MQTASLGLHGSPLTRLHTKPRSAEWHSSVPFIPPGVLRPDPMLCRSAGRSRRRCGRDAGRRTGSATAPHRRSHSPRQTPRPEEIHRLCQPAADQQAGHRQGKQHKQQDLHRFQMHSERLLFPSCIRSHNGWLSVYSIAHHTETVYCFRKFLCTLPYFSCASMRSLRSLR